MSELVLSARNLVAGCGIIVLVIAVVVGLFNYIVERFR